MELTVIQHAYWRKNLRKCRFIRRICQPAQGPKRYGQVAAGLSTTVYYMVTTQPWMRGLFGITAPVQLRWDIEPISAGLFGVPVGFAVILLVSLVAPAASKKFLELVK